MKIKVKTIDSQVHSIDIDNEVSLLMISSSIFSYRYVALVGPVEAAQSVAAGKA
jgi:hypothetical protein